jgi:hypothetical protein
MSDLESQAELEVKCAFGAIRTSASVKARGIRQLSFASAVQQVREIWMLVEGAMVMVLIQGDRSYAATAAVRQPRSHQH